MCVFMVLHTLHIELLVTYTDRTLTTLRLPPGNETVGSKSCDHVVDGVAIGVRVHVVKVSRVTVETIVSLKME